MKFFDYKVLEQTYTYRLCQNLFKVSMPMNLVVGMTTLLLLKSLKSMLRGNLNIKKIMDQAAHIGWSALGISITMSTITGMIVALQVAIEMVRQGAGEYVGGLVALTMVRELGPIMTGFAVTALIGSAIAAEVATMKVTEQIDAMVVFRVDPIAYLAVPTIFAGMFAVPLLVVIATATGIIGGMIVCKITTNLNILIYLDSIWNFLEVKDLWVNVLKGMIFGLLIVAFSMSIGLETKGGAKEVGESTTNAVVWSFLSIIIANYVMSLMYYG